MIEGDWLSCKDPRRMLDYLLNGDRGKLDLFRPAVTTDRKLRLFACGAVLQVWHLLTDERSRQAVEVAERYADGEETEAVLHKAHLAAHWVTGTHKPGPLMAAAECCSGVPVAERVVQCLLMHQPEKQAALLRCVFGNPFCLPNLSPVGLDWADLGEPWRTPYLLAQATYAVRAWDRLPFLADALDEAGCTDQVILDHLRPRTCPECNGKGRRGPGGGMRCLGCYGTGKIGHTGPHCRGCFVVDLLLGKR